MCRFLLAAILVAASISSTPASAQDNFPTKPIKIVLPLPAGSALDIATRAIGDQLSSRWGQQVLIEARPGAGGLIAGQAVASAPHGRANDVICLRTAFVQCGASKYLLRPNRWASVRQ